MTTRPTALIRLMAVRCPLYAELADVVLDVDDLTPAAVADRIIDAVDASAEPSLDFDTRSPGRPDHRRPDHRRSDHRAPAPAAASGSDATAVHALSVDLAERSYPVLVGPGARHEVARFVPSDRQGGRDRRRSSRSRTPAGSTASTPACPSRSASSPTASDAKTLATVEVLTRFFAGAGLSRADVVVAVGGGIVTDVAGFAAATYHRGTAYLNVATSLLAQVDAAIGGKTGVNLPEGKNLVGAFWQPDAVLCDTETLATPAAP